MGDDSECNKHFKLFEGAKARNHCNNMVRGFHNACWGSCGVCTLTPFYLTDVPQNVALSHKYPWYCSAFQYTMSCGIFSWQFEFSIFSNTFLFR